MIENAYALKEDIKLVIWDLDETLWSGTLSEGAVDFSTRHKEVVLELSRRGIVNSICSKNDYEDVKSRLIAEDGLWCEFVFPRISWNPKGPQIADIIETAQLRSSQVLFIDDNPGNLHEASFFAPGIQTSGPEIIAKLLDLEQLASKDDSNKTRLAQYKLLEVRAQTRQSSDGSNEDFLRSSNISVVSHEDCLAPSNFDRIAELILRTNQLNFTKRRLDRGELHSLLSEPGRVSRFVEVSDQFGDYGVVGFYSLKEEVLTDFLFSCRILNMGVEQWIYDQLGSPTIEVRGEVASTLASSEPIDWINQGAHVRARVTSPSIGPVAGDQILLKGACDLIAVNDFLGGSLNTEFNGITSVGEPEHRGHTDIIRRSFPDVVDQYGPMIDQLPFVDRESYETKIFTSHYRVLVLSVLADYSQGLYRLRGTDYVVPYGFYDDDITDLQLLEEHPERLNWLRLTPDFVRFFADNFEFLGGISTEAFQENIRWLSRQMDPGTRIVLVNAGDVPAPDISFEKSRHLRHREMNRALDEVIEELDNVTLIDVRKLITRRDDFTDSVVRYRRRVYLKIAEEIRKNVEGNVEVKPFSRAAIDVSLAGTVRAAKKKIPPRLLQLLGRVRRVLKSATNRRATRG